MQENTPAPRSATRRQIVFASRADYTNDPKRRSASVLGASRRPRQRGSDMYDAPTPRTFSTPFPTPQAAPDRVVIACAPPRALALAAAFGANGVIPVLAFDSEQFFRCAHAGAELAVVEPHITGSTPLVVAAAENHVGLLVVADMDRLDHDVRAVAVGVLKP